MSEIYIVLQPAPLTDTLLARVYWTRDDEPWRSQYVGVDNSDEIRIPFSALYEFTGADGVYTFRIAAVNAAGFPGNEAVGTHIIGPTPDPMPQPPISQTESFGGIAFESESEPPIEPPAPTEGIWVSPDEIMPLPTTGAAWDAVVSASQRGGSADVSDQDSQHDVTTLGQALVAVRTGQDVQQAIDSVVSAIGTEDGGRWLAVGRNLLSYVIAADVLGLRDDGNPSSDGSRVQAWIAQFLTRTLAHNNTGEQIPFIPFASGSNASAQEGAAYIACAAYLGDTTAIERGWDAYRTYAGDPTAPDHEGINLARGVEAGWAHDDDNPVAVNPLGSTKDGHRIDGAIINDMRRGGDFKMPPDYTSYPWVGLEGFVPAALILHRAGYPAFQVADQAVLRTHTYLWFLRTETGNNDWFDGSRANEVIHLVNHVYGENFPMNAPTGAGRTVGFTDWTHG